MEEPAINVNILKENKTVSVSVPYTPSTTAEDICITLCRDLKIGTVARHLFGLRYENKNIFLMPAATFKPKGTFDLRIRFKVCNITKLKRLDLNAYDYYFHQARCDVLENKIPELLNEKYNSELVGLGITDMYRVMLEKQLTKEHVMNNYKKYIPKEVIARHRFFVKKPIVKALTNLEKLGRDDWFVKGEYLKQLDMLAPEYLIEEYKALTEMDGSDNVIYVRVSPYHPTMPGLKYCSASKREQWVQICTIDDLGFVSIRNDGTVEISRKNGIPFYLKFFSVPDMLSFVSLLDGYYRLSVKWTFNICSNVFTPSLRKLYDLKSHGPVGGEFSYAKLEEKRSNKPGCFILRESELEYDVFYIDICTNDSRKPKTFKLDLGNKNGFTFDGDVTLYHSIQEVLEAYNKPEGSLFLQECLPPSEYDKSFLLLCQPDSFSRDSLTDSSTLDGIIPPKPICINSEDLQVFKGQKKESSEGITVVFRSMWKVTKGKKIEAAKKVLKDENCDRYLKEFIKLAGQWGLLRSTAIVRLFGITLVDQVSMVMEYLRYGPLHVYLQEKKATIKQVDLLEASANLASALWHLEEHGIIHGKIRCRKLLVHSHDENCFIVKLADPGIRTSYASSEVHWIPIECYSNPDFAKRYTAADVWAFATTLYEIFTFGEPIRFTDHMEFRKFYIGGKRLPKPEICPNEIYLLMRECWETDPHRRKQPHAIMRDINQLLYQVHNSRKVHSYAKVNPKSKLSSQSVRASSSSSLNTENTFLPYKDDEVSGSLTHSRHWLMNSQEFDNYEDGSCDMSAIMSNFTFSTATTSLESFGSMQSIFELNADCHVVLQGRIGQGFYGEVYRAMLEYVGNEEQEPQLVAVKKLKTNANASFQQDFEREISIMKTLKHPNIVRILGVLQEPEISLVMEFVQHGSLQSYLKIYHDSLSTKQLLKYALDIANGMDYLGKMNIVHRDLAARNILVVDENNVKISDFGLAQVMGTNDYYILKTNRDLPIKWYALESLRDGKFSVRSDVWSYGVTMCEMFGHGEDPQLTGVDLSKEQGKEQQILLSALEKGSRFPCPPLCPQAVYASIIYPCWKADPHERPLFNALCLRVENLLVQS